MRLDVHIIKMAGETTDHLEEALKDLEGVKVYKGKATVGHIGKGRARGFRKGQAPYVAYADPDDEILPEHIDDMLAILDSDPGLAGVCPTEHTETPDGRRFIRRSQMTPKHGRVMTPAQIVRCAHHMVIFRRELLEPYLDDLEEFENWGEFAVLAKMALDGRAFVFYDRPAYVWRPSENGAHRTIQPPAKARELIQEAWGWKHGGR